jgi:P27 family predicted phage terminase small subunit
MAVLLAKKNIPAPTDFDGVALEKWVEISERIAARGDWQDYNLGPLRILCLAYAAHDQATKTIATLGDVLESERGYTRNPACLNQNAAAGTIAKLSAQLGETPISRGRLKAPAAPIGNDFDEI